tara:strand:- start:872 stop:1249 length:378 start_codon:yes stop_codon:yes gene_type:complete
MNIPNDLHYTKEHEWIKIKGDVGIIGITDYAQNELGDVVFVELPSENEKVIKGNSIGTIEAVKTVADLYSPINGTIIEVNSELENEPELINKNPYSSGWIIKVKISTLSEVKELLNSKEYEALIK